MIIVANHGRAFKDNQDETFEEMDASEVILKDCVPFIVHVLIRLLRMTAGNAIITLSMN